MRHDTSIERFESTDAVYKSRHWHATSPFPLEVALGKRM